MKLDESTKKGLTFALTIFTMVFGVLAGVQLAMGAAWLATMSGLLCVANLFAVKAVADTEAV